MIKSLVLSTLSTLSVLTGVTSSLLNTKLESQYKKIVSDSFLTSKKPSNAPSYNAWSLILNSGSFSYLTKLIHQLRIEASTEPNQEVSSGLLTSSSELYPQKLQQLVNSFLGDLSWTHLIEVLEEKSPSSNGIQPNGDSLNLKNLFPKFKSRFLSLNQWLELSVAAVTVWILSCISLSGSTLFFCSKYNKLEKTEKLKWLIYHLLTQLPGWLFKYRTKLSNLKESKPVLKSKPLFSGNVNAFSISNLNYSINGAHILKNINLTLRKNEFYAIIGSNGAGKTTLLKHFGKILSPDSGELLLGSKKINSVNNKDFWERVAYIPQEVSIPPDTPVYDFLLSARFISMNRTRKANLQDHLKVLQAIRRCSLQQLRWSKIGDLSGGQRQKVILASILVKDADLILLDEPTTFLDIDNRNFVISFFKELHSTGRTIIANLHKFSEINQLATEIIALKEGRLREEGRKENLLTPSFLNSLYDLNLSTEKWSSLMWASKLNY